MPSPVGHALGGLTAGWLLQPRPSSPPPLVAAEHLVFVALAIAPDLDLFGVVHRGASHPLAATLVVGAIAWRARRGPDRTRFAVAAAAAYGSHVLLDWMGVDTSPPFGVPALWPLTDAYLQSPWQPFAAVSRRFHQPGLFWAPNAAAVGREILILLPMLILVGWWRGRLRLPRRAPRR